MYRVILRNILAMFLKVYEEAKNLLLRTDKKSYLKAISQSYKNFFYKCLSLFRVIYSSEFKLAG